MRSGFEKLRSLGALLVGRLFGRRRSPHDTDGDGQFG